MKYHSQYRQLSKEFRQLKAASFYGTIQRKLLFQM